MNPAHLFLGTSSDNSVDAFEKGRRAIGHDHHKAKLTDADVTRIRGEYGAKSLRQLAREFDVAVHAIQSIVKRRIWKHVA